jgi:hypothetical protein
MRYLSALIVGLGLSLPSIGHAATPENAPQGDRSSVHASTPAAVRTSDKAATVKTTPVKAATDDKSRYAAREAASPQAQSYRGGDTIVIGASTAAVILAVVLILVLI